MILYVISFYCDSIIRLLCFHCFCLIVMELLAESTAAAKELLMPGSEEAAAPPETKLKEKLDRRFLSAATTTTTTTTTSAKLPRVARAKASPYHSAAFMMIESPSLPISDGPLGGGGTSSRRRSERRQMQMQMQRRVRRGKDEEEPPRFTRSLPQPRRAVRGVSTKTKTKSSSSKPMRRDPQKTKASPYDAQLIRSRPTRSSS